jgi:hypothetical protein
MFDSNLCSQRSPRSWSIPTCWLILILLDFCLVAFALAQDAQPRPVNQPQQVAEIRIPAPDDAKQDAMHFEAIDVFVDSGTQSLAAWQLELLCLRTDVEIVGIEGGEHPAFKEPPYYDPRAMNHNRVILGSFNTAGMEQLPKGRSRVARVHVQVKGGGDRPWNCELTTAATTDGRRIEAKIDVTKAQG